MGIVALRVIKSLSNHPSSDYKTILSMSEQNY